VTGQAAGVGDAETGDIATGKSPSAAKQPQLNGGSYALAVAAGSLNGTGAARDEGPVAKTLEGSHKDSKRGRHTAADNAGAGPPIEEKPRAP
jgi:hypothetical protein